MVRLHRHALANRWLADGLAYCLERDLDAWDLYMRGWLARSLLEQGDMDSAVREPEQVLRHPRTFAISRIQPLSVVVRAGAWTGKGDGKGSLEEMRELALGTGEGQRVSIADAAACEVAWIEGDEDRVSALAAEAWQIVSNDRAPWTRGEIATWLGAPLDEVGPVAPPYEAEVRGEWDLAARLWGELGSPFARALALARGGTRDGLAEAALSFDAIGARSAAARARALSRARRWQPSRGVRADTRVHPEGLTRREAEVLELLVQGLSDAAIAEKLVLSPRTVQHHVAAILGKLGVSSRRDVRLG
jgi:DNA-binding CsgD family transcriptional regulator